MVLTRAFLQTLCKNSSSYIDSSCVEEVSGSTSALDSSMAINEFLFSLNIDNINLVKLLQYIKESNIIHKVSDCSYTLLCIPCHSELSFISFYLNFPNAPSQVSGGGDKTTSSQKNSALKDDGETSEEGSILSDFQALVGFLLSLTNNDGDGRIIISRTRPTCSGQRGGCLKYVMLTGEKIFSEVCPKF